MGVYVICPIPRPQAIPAPPLEPAPGASPLPPFPRIAPSPSPSQVCPVAQVDASPDKPLPTRSQDLGCQRSRRGRARPGRRLRLRGAAGQAGRRYRGRCGGAGCQGSADRCGGTKGRSHGSSTGDRHGSPLRYVTSVRRGAVRPSGKQGHFSMRRQECPPGSSTHGVIAEIHPGSNPEQ